MNIEIGLDLTVDITSNPYDGSLALEINGQQVSMDIWPQIIALGIVDIKTANQIRKIWTTKIPVTQ